MCWCSPGSTRASYQKLSKFSLPVASGFWCQNGHGFHRGYVSYCYVFHHFCTLTIVVWHCSPRSNQPAYRRDCNSARNYGSLRVASWPCCRLQLASTVSLPDFNGRGSDLPFEHACYCHLSIDQCDNSNGSGGSDPTVPWLFRHWYPSSCQLRCSAQ